MNLFGMHLVNCGINFLKRKITEKRQFDITELILWILQVLVDSPKKSQFHFWCPSWINNKNISNKNHFLTPFQESPSNPPPSVPDKWDTLRKCHLLSRDFFQACCKVKEPHPRWQKSWSWWPTNYPSKHRLVGSRLLPWARTKVESGEGEVALENVERCWYPNNSFCHL